MMRMKQNLCALMLLLSSVFGAACGFVNYFTTPLASDRKISNYYDGHQAELEKLAAMLREDLQKLSAVPQFSKFQQLYFHKGCVEQRKCNEVEFEKANISEARRSEYYDILSKIPEFLTLAATHGNPSPLAIFLKLSSEDNRSSSIICSKGLYFSDTQPASISDWSLDWNDCSSLAIYREGSSIYRPVKDGWYIYLSGVDTENLP